MKNTNILLITLFVLLLFNAGSAFVLFSGYIKTFTYAIRIALYLYFLIFLQRTTYPHKLKNSFLYKFNRGVPFLLIISVGISLFLDQNLNSVISRIFSTFFLLADNLVFMYLGFTCIERMEDKYNDIDILWMFAIISILLMTGVTFLAKLTFGDLEQLWNTVREGNNALDKFLGVYKNSNPYKFAILAGFLYIKQSKYNIWLTLLCLINILIVGKRGPLFASFLAVVMVFFFTKERKTKYIKYTIYFVALFGIFYFVIDNSIFDTIAYRMDISQHTTRENDASFYTSGRNDIWEILLWGLNKSNEFFLLIGNGVLGTYNLLTQADGPGNAHNTWLEVFYNFGVLGFFLYLSYYLHLFKIHRVMHRSLYEYSNVFLFITTFSFISTFYTVTYLGGFVAPGYANLMVSYLFGRYLYPQIRN